MMMWLVVGGLLFLILFRPIPDDEREPRISMRTRLRGVGECVGDAVSGIVDGFTDGWRRDRRATTGDARGDDGR